MTRQQYIVIFKACTFYNEIMNNFYNGDVECKYTRDFANLVRNYIPERWVDYAAVWQTTPQGNDYWYDINNAWRSFVQGGGANFDTIGRWYIPVDESVINCPIDWKEVFKGCSFYQAVVDNYNSGFGGADTIEEYLEETSPVNFVGYAFSFEESNESYDYWEEIHEKWKYAVMGNTLQPISEYYTPATGHGESFSVVMPKIKSITLDFKL